MNTVVISARVPKAMATEIDAMTGDGNTRSDVIQMLLQQALARQSVAAPRYVELNAGGHLFGRSDQPPRPKLYVNGTPDGS